MQDSREYHLPLSLSNDPDQWYQPDPHFVGYAQSLSDLFRILGDAADSIIDAYADAFTDFISIYGHLKPWMEAQLGHAAVCEHKVKCKPIGPGAAFNTPAAQTRRR